MKTYIGRSTLLATVLVATSLMASTTFGGPDSEAGVLSNSTENQATGGEPAASKKEAAACTDARVIASKEAKWVPGQGRGMIIVDAGKAVVCTSCATPPLAAKAHDRNTNGAKVSKASKGLHECGPSGCGGSAPSA